MVNDATWYENIAAFGDYWEALVWAMVTLESLSAAEEVRVVRVIDGKVRVVPIRPEEVKGFDSSPAVRAVLWYHRRLPGFENFDSSSGAVAVSFTPR